MEPREFQVLNDPSLHPQHSQLVYLEWTIRLRNFSAQSYPLVSLSLVTEERMSPYELARTVYLVCWTGHRTVMQDEEAEGDTSGMAFLVEELELLGFLEMR